MLITTYAIPNVSPKLQAIRHYSFKGTFRRAAAQKQLLAELYQELWDKPKARSAYEAAAQWYEDDNASALANRFNPKVGDLAAVNNDYLGAVGQAVTNNLMQSSIND